MTARNATVRAFILDGPRRGDTVILACPSGMPPADIELPDPRLLRLPRERRRSRARRPAGSSRYRLLDYDEQRDSYVYRLARPVGRDWSPSTLPPPGNTGAPS